MCLPVPFLRSISIEDVSLSNAEETDTCKKEAKVNCSEQES